MAVTIVFLGKLADQAGMDELSADAPLDWAGLLAALPESVAASAAADSTKLALNGALLAAKSALDAGEGDEIALLPPVSGG